MPFDQTHHSRKLTASEQADLIRRGLAAWLGAGGAAQDGGRHVTARTASKGTELGGVLHYVVVHAGAVVLACYRVRPDNLALRKLTRIPRDLVGRKG